MVLRASRKATMDSGWRNQLRRVPNGAVLYLPGLQGDDSAKAVDYSGFANDGTITGATWKRLPSGLWYLYFDSVNDHVDCGAASSLDITGDKVTIMAWVHSPLDWTHSETYVGVITKDYDAAYGLLMSKGGNIYLGIKLAAAHKSAISTSTVSASTWTHICGMYDGAELSLYINGTKDATTTAATGDIQSDASNLEIGRDEDEPTRLLKGSVALARVYSVALSVAQIADCYGRERYLFGE